MGKKNVEIFWIAGAAAGEQNARAARAPDWLRGMAACVLRLRHEGSRSGEIRVGVGRGWGRGRGRGWGWVGR